MSDEKTGIQCFLRLHMAGGQIQKTYRVEPETWERLEILLDEPLRKKDGYDFFSFDTLDGRSVSISLPDIQMVNYVSGNHDPEKDEANFSGIRLYFRHTLLPASIMLADDIEAFFLESVVSSTTRDEPFFSFLDRNGERCSFNLDHLLIMELSTQQVCQGRLAEMAAEDPAPSANG